MIIILMKFIVNFSDRLTGVLMSDILTHPFFLEVDWEDMECGSGDLAVYPPALKLLKRSAENSDYSPPSAAIGSNSKMRHKLLDLDEVLVSFLRCLHIINRTQKRIHILCPHRIFSC